MTCLLELSHELLHCIFADIHPADLASLSGSCRTLYTYISGNRLLHKEIYIQRYDTPPTRGKDDEPNWEEQLHRLVKLEKILECENRDVKGEQMGFVTDAVMDMLQSADRDVDHSMNVRMLSAAFAEEGNMDVFLRASSMFRLAGTEHQRAAPTVALQQASAKLHALYGKYADPVPSTRCSAHYSVSPFFAVRSIEIHTGSPSSNTRTQSQAFPAHTVARSRVYDLRNYTTNTLWGPFLNDGTQRVDWEKIEAIMHVLGWKLDEFTQRSGGRFESPWANPFHGATPYSYSSLPSPERQRPTNNEDDHELSLIRELEPSLDILDPYGVSGTWMRIVCFLDYNDLYAFNFSSRIADGQPREPIDTEEGIIELDETLQVTRVVSAEEADEEEAEGNGDDELGMDWSGFKGERLPVVYFTGTSRSLHASWDPNANSRIRGSVRQTPEGEIRWTTFSIFHGEERWRSEGIQVGGVQSARGVLGSWFDKDFDQHGPAGPTAFWKVTDDLAEEKSSTMPLAFF